MKCTTDPPTIDRVRTWTSETPRRYRRVSGRCPKCTAPAFNSSTALAVSVRCSGDGGCGHVARWEEWRAMYDLAEPLHRTFVGYARLPELPARERGSGVKIRQMPTGAEIKVTDDPFNAQRQRRFTSVEMRRITEECRTSGRCPECGMDIAERNATALNGAFGYVEWHCDSCGFTCPRT